MTGLDEPPREIEEHPVTREALAGYAGIPIAFEVRSVLEVADAGLDGIRLVERPVMTPWVKDYDVIPGQEPARWPDRFDVTRWGMLIAREGGERAGGGVVAWRTPGLDMLEGRDDLAVLWDLRVAPDRRGRGVGSRLFEAVAAWAEARGCRHLEVETQDVNVPACRLYAARGCTLRSITRSAYRECPDEARLVWRRVLG